MSTIGKKRTGIRWKKILFERPFNNKSNYILMDRFQIILWKTRLTCEWMHVHHINKKSPWDSSGLKNLKCYISCNLNRV